MINVFTVDDYLDHMRQAIEDVDSIVSHMTRANYDADRKSQLAVQKAMENLGEAARQCSANYPDFADGESRIPWSKLTGFRNVLSHKYFDVNQDIVWNTAQNRLPDLRRTLDEIAEEDDYRRTLTAARFGKSNGREG